MQDNEKSVTFRPPPVRRLLLALFVLVWAVLTAGAQNAGKDAKANKDAEAKPQATLPPTRVIEAYRQGPKPDTTVEVGDDLVVTAEHLDTLLKQAQSTRPPKKILLFLDGRPLKDVTPFPPTDPGKSILYFPLQRTESSRDVWTHILGKPGWQPRPTTVSIGLEDSYSVESTATINLRVIPVGWFVFWSLLFLLLLAGFLALAVQSNLLRDPGPNPEHGRKPYSLSRMQAAWWFFLVLASYLFIGMVTGDWRTSITGTVLVLIGISAGTAMGAAVIDAGKPPPGGAPPQSTSWWLDILSDANGVSFHRFQIAAWTVVLGIIFVVQVYCVLAMPTFDNSLLALMGISAGTYLGLKIPEPR
jgi:hypothetical protein